MDVGSQFDVVVVGSGAGGAAVAWRLCDLGMRVLILEAGPRFDPATDYPLAEKDWERQGFPVKPGSQAKLSFGDLGSLTPDIPELRSWNRVSGRLVDTPQRRVSGQGYAHVQGVGGSTLHFIGESHRLHPDCMALNTSFGFGHDWPLTYADLEAHYTMCEDLIGVAGPKTQGDRWRSRKFPLPPHPLNPSANRLVDAGALIGMEWQANSRAALSQSYDGRPQCNYCGNCAKGCPVGDKGSADVTFIRHAESTGRLVIKSGCPVTIIHTGANGNATSVEFIELGVRKTVETPKLVLAAGAIQTPRLLLASASSETPNGVANGSGQVGKNFLETLAWTSTGFLDDLENSHMGLPADAISWDFNAPNAIPGVVGGCRFNTSVKEIGLNGPIAYTTRIIAGFGRELKSALRQNFGKAISITAIGEVLPNTDSFVDLDLAQNDEFGVPLPRIHAKLGPQEITRMKFMAMQSRKLLAAAGVSELVEELGTWDNFATTHAFGTCIMAKDSNASVVSANCQTHDHPNLYITDASVFPSSGGGEAPSLTIQALAVRTAEVIAE